MTLKAVRRHLLASVLTLVFGALGLMLAPQSAHAAGEVYEWKDFRTIKVTGGDLKGESDILLSNAQVSGDTMAIFGGNLLYNKGGSKGCTVSISIYLFKSNGTGGGRIWNPPPYDNTAIGDPNAPPRCYLSGFKDIDPALHNQWVTIGGTRPADPNAPERPEEKRFDVIVLAPDALSKVPASDTIYIYKKDGTKVAEQSSPFHDDSGQADWPPDQTPASLQVNFSLEPGDYVVCDTYVAKECSYAKATAEQKFTKKKYETGIISIGKQFQTPDKKRINVHVNYHTKVPCGSSVTLSPVNVEVTGPTGDNSKVINKQTNAGNSGANLPGEEDALCTKDVSIGVDAVFDDMAPGEYKFCTTGAECVVATKVDGEPLNVTLEVKGEQVAPPDQKVCTSGDGVAGALAWIICPATQLIASATDFFENNIIIPFMTVSPLTTNANNPIYVLWKNFRDFANLGFVILLFISIFSIALSKFGLKRVMPRLLIVAVGINLSYFVVAFIIDAFNIFGGGISQLIISALHQAGTTQLNTGTSAGTVRSIFTLGGAALLTILLTGGSAIGWLFSFLGLAALIVVVVVLVLIVRQIAIITLVILSPLAILLYMLPNTEQYFTKWRKTLIQLLMMYPMIVLLFAAGKIFGIILQQPDFKITGDGVSDEVAQAVRVILQFLVYVVPLVFLPATFAASGSLMGKMYGWFNNRAIQPRAQRLGEDASQARREAQMRLARNGIARRVGIGQLAGRSLNRDYARDQRRRNLAREQEEFVAGSVGNSAWLRRRAAGVSGQAGQTRAAATAAKVAEKGRTEDLEAERSLLTQEMRRLGMDEDTFAERTAEYLENPNDPATRVITGTNGQQFDFAANSDRLQRALLDSAASQGYVRAIEAARLNTQIDQRMVDDIIRRNDGTLKGKGGYHLATQFNLAAGRMQVHDPSTGALRAPANAAEASAEMQAQRLVAIAQTGANSIAGMKSGLLISSADLLDTPGPQRDAVLQTMDHISAEESAKRGAPVNFRTMLRGQVDQILAPGSAQTLANSDVSRQDFERIRNGII